MPPGTNGGPSVAGTRTETFGIKDVWGYNLEEEMRRLNRLVKKYPFVAIDTEFPGVVARPCGVFNTNSDYEYALFKVNVDLMKIIQLGLSFFDENGLQPEPIHTWQFNFRFHLSEEMYAQDSIKLLMHSGINFSLHEQLGIDPDAFAERLITSNILCNEQVKFLTFHSAYDFGYLLKVLEGAQNLPKTETGFLEKLKMYFPHIYDIKFMIRDFHKLKGGLQDLANQFHLVRVGAQHQAGSDSALTGALFFRLLDEVFHGKVQEFSGRLFGLTGSFGDRVHHLENVVIKENPKNNTASPISAFLSEDSQDNDNKNSISISSNPFFSSSSSLSLGTSSSSHNQQSGSNSNQLNTYTLLTNVHVSQRFLDERNATGYMVSSPSNSSGEIMVSNDPNMIHQQQHIFPSGNNSSYYDSNGGF